MIDGCFFVLKAMMLSLEDLEKEVIINNCFTELSFNSYVRKLHVYKDIWNPRIAKDCLKWRNERKKNEHGGFAKCLYRNDEMEEKIVVHIPFYLSQAMFKLFHHSQSKLCFTVTGMQVNRSASLGLEVPVKYTFYVHEKILNFLETETLKNSLYFRK